MGSLDAVNGWFLTHINERHETETTDLPSWWDPAKATAETAEGQNRPFTSAQLALIDEMQAYVAEVMTTARPDAKWVIYTGHKLESRNGQSMLQIGNSRPFPVRSEPSTTSY